jgi:hypothetical protein
MQSRAMRMALSVAALAVSGAAAFVLISSEDQISARREAFRAFDARAREVVGALGVMRSAQLGYVAAGQSIAIWAPEVSTLIASTASGIADLQHSAASLDAGRALAEAASRVAGFGDADKRVRDYVHGGEQLMAADVVFTEGSEAVAAAGHQVEAARVDEERAFDAFEREERGLQANVLAGGAVCVLLIVALLVPRASSEPRAVNADAAAPADIVLDHPLDAVATGSLLLRDVGGNHPPANEALPRDAVPALRQAAALCTDFGRVNNVDELNILLGRAADVMDASGLVIWLGAVGGPILRPVLAHGYPAQALAQMPAVLRSTDNAAAAAYRTGRFQIVLAQPGGASGAVVAPLLTPDGCIGALTAEMKGGTETSDGAQALAAIFAAQLAGVLASSVPAADQEDGAASRTAAG